MKKYSHTLIFIGLCVFLLGDTVYSFYQHLLAPMDGDIASIVAPADAYRHVLTDPLGIRVLKTGDSYAATNRFFAYWTTYYYFREVPLWLQHFMFPITSIYVASALAKTLIQAGLIFVLSLYIVIPLGFSRTKGVFAAALITPLFQATGFFEYMAFIDNCISYAFAYAFPSLLLLIFLLPYYNAALTGSSGLHAWAKPFWLLWIFLLAFNGPLTGPVLLIVCPSVLLYFGMIKWKKLPDESFLRRVIKTLTSINRELLLSFGLTTIVCLYSFYIGTYNSENQWNPIPLSERFDRLWQGIPKAFFDWNEGLLLLLTAMGINLAILFRMKAFSYAIVRHVFLWSLFFCVVYICLLPFGGYRDYRPYVIRRDTVQPVLLVLFFVWGFTTLFLLQRKFYLRYVYAFGLAMIGFYYTYCDGIPSYTNACERETLKKIAASETDCVELQGFCNALQWSPNTHCEESQHQAFLLHYWNITPREIRYCHKIVVSKQ